MSRKIGNAHSIKLKSKSMLSLKINHTYIYMFVFGVWIIGRFEKKPTMDFYLPKQLPSSPLANEMRNFCEEIFPVLSSHLFLFLEMCNQMSNKSIVLYWIDGYLKIVNEYKVGVCVTTAFAWKKGVISTSLVSFGWIALSTQL